MSKESSEKNVVLENIEKLTKSIGEFTKKAEENQAYIKKISDYIKALPQIIADKKNSLANQNQQFEKVKADLIPYFDKLKNYFYYFYLLNFCYLFSILLKKIVNF